jgi:hypothetical protein
MLTDTSGLGYSYRISDHYCYIMFNTVDVIIMLFHYSYCKISFVH